MYMYTVRTYILYKCVSMYEYCHGYSINIVHNNNISHFQSQHIRMYFTRLYVCSNKQYSTYVHCTYVLYRYYSAYIFYELWNHKQFISFRGILPPKLEILADSAQWPRLRIIRTALLRSFNFGTLFESDVPAAAHNT